MAAAIIIGNAHRISASILAPVTSISVIIASAFNEAVSDMDNPAPISLRATLSLHRVGGASHAAV
jgi:phosphate transport system permease protein